MTCTLASAGSVVIQPIQVCDDAGLNCGDPNRTLFESETNKIWAQAGIDVLFLPWNVFDSTAFLDLEGAGQSTLDDLVVAANNGANANALVLNFWFVNSISGAFGEAFLGSNGGAIGNNVFSFGLQGRIDTIAHELGHNLGLPHWDDANGCAGANANHLMTNGGCRNVPSTISDITPDGLGLDLLGASEISTAQRSDFAQATPEPAALGLVGAGLFSLLVIRRRAA